MKIHICRNLLQRTAYETRLTEIRKLPLLLQIHGSIAGQMMEEKGIGRPSTYAPTINIF